MTRRLRAARRSMRLAEPPCHPVILSNAVRVRRANQGDATGVRAAVSPLVVGVTGAAAAATRAESTIALMTSNGCEPETMRPPITNDGATSVVATSKATHLVRRIVVTWALWSLNCTTAAGTVTA